MEQGLTMFYSYRLFLQVRVRKSAFKVVCVQL